MDHKDGKTLLIEKVNAGMVNSWNQEHPEQPVKPGDRIIAVNGASGDAMKVAGECKAASVLELTLRREIAARALERIAQSGGEAGEPSEGALEV